MSIVLKTVDTLDKAVEFIKHPGHTDSAIHLLRIATLQSSAAILDLSEFIANCYQKRDEEWLVIYPDGLIPKSLPLPWASHASKKSRLRGPQRSILRRFLLVHQVERPQSPFLYSGRQWYLDIQKYPVEGQAQAWLDMVITSQRWMQFGNELRRSIVRNGAS